MASKTIGQRIHETRLEMNMTLVEVAEKIGCTASTIQRYEADAIVKPKMPVIESIANALGVNPSWLIGKSDVKTSQVEAPALSENEIAMLDGFRKLNEQGQEKALEYIELLLMKGENLAGDNSAKVG